MSQRLVRFQQFLPYADAAQQETREEDTSALFSPSARTGSKHLLHSIFSPTFNAMSSRPAAGGAVVADFPAREVPAPVKRKTMTTSTAQKPSAAQQETQESDTSALFSPSARIGSEHLLHSIFSPTFNAMSSKPAAAVGFPAPGEGPASVKRKTLTPARMRQAFPINGRTPKTPASKRKQNQSHQTQEELFFSPEQSINNSLFSPFSAISRYTEASGGTRASSRQSQLGITTAKLTIGYIGSCCDSNELQCIVQFLTEKQKYPTLLRTAQERLSVVNLAQQEHVPASTRLPTMPVPSPRPNLSLSRSNHHNESTLIMSLSSDDESELPLSPESTTTTLPKRSPSPSQQLADIQRVIVSPATRSTEQDALCAQVQRLTETIVQLENGRLTDQRDYLLKLQLLQDTKAQAQERIQSLNSFVTSTNEASLELTKVLESTRSDNHSIQLELDRARELQAQKDRQAAELEQELTIKVQELTSELWASQNPARVVSLERKNKDLNFLLGSAQRNLQEIKRERVNMLHSLLAATGDKETKVNQLSKTDRSKLVWSVSQVTVSSKAAVNAMAKALKEAEQRAVEADARFKNTRKSSRRFEQDNLQLTKQLQELSLDITASRAQADHLVKSARDKHQTRWMQQEASYKQAIQSLKKQLRTEETTVSLKLYRSAVQDVKAKTAQCQGHREEVTTLKAQVAQLQQTLQKHPARANKVQVAPLTPKEMARPGKKAKDPSTPKAKDLPSKTTRQRSALKDGNVENMAPPKTPKTPRPAATFNFVPVIDKSKSRFSMVRAAGGRKGLQEKLNQVRSPRAGRVKFQA